MTDKRPNLNVVELGNETDVEKIKALVEQIRRQFPARLPVFEMIARERWAQFEAYKTAGFDAYQALRLIVAEIQRPAAQ